MTAQTQRLRGPARALLVIDQPVLADVVRLALNHGHYTTRVAGSVDEAVAALADWQPHLVVLDMDIAGNTILSGKARQPFKVAASRSSRSPGGATFSRS